MEKVKDYRVRLMFNRAYEYHNAALFMDKVACMIGDELGMDWLRSDVIEGEFSGLLDRVEDLRARYRRERDRLIAAYEKHGGSCSLLDD